MKAICLLQPWASAVELGLKTVETRSWKTAYRGRLAICASRRVAWSEARKVLLLQKMAGGELPTGCVVAVADLVDVLPVEAGLWSEQQREWGDFSPGRFAWLLANVVPIPEHPPIRGQLGLFNFDVDPRVLSGEVNP